MGSDVQPHIMLVRSASQAMTILIGRCITRAIRCKLGYTTVPNMKLRCLDILRGGVIGDESDHAIGVLAVYLNGMLESGAIDLIAANYLPAEHRLRAEFMVNAKAMSIVSSPPTVNHRFTLTPGSFADTMKQLSGKRRYQVRRENRLLMEHFDQDVQFVELARVEEVDQAIGWASNIARHTYKRSLGAGCRDDAKWRTILQSDALAGRLRAWFLICRGEPIAYVLASVHDRVCFVDDLGFLPQYARLSPGKNTLVRAIERLCEQGMGCVDYGIGDAEYKRVFGTTSDREATLHVYAGTVRARISAFIEHSVRRANTVGGRVLDRFEIMKSIRKRWRTRLTAKK